MNYPKTRTVLPCLLLATLMACEVETGPEQVDYETTGIYVPVPEREEPTDEPCADELPEGITSEEIEDAYNAAAAITGGEEQANQLCPLFQMGDPAAIEHSAENLPPPDANARWAWTKLRAHTKLTLDASAVEALGCGPSDIGEVFCAPQALDPAETEFIIVVHIVDDTIPLGSSEYHGQYGFVFDRNGIAEDNYVADPQYPNDFYKGTDVWYQLQLYPNEGTFFGVLDATNNAIQPFASAAKMIVKGKTILLVIPKSEMEADCPGHRVTAFTHLGDYGFEAPNFWAGDTEPTVDEELEPVCR